MVADIIYQELSYQLIGIAYTVFNKTGFGMSEKFYQNLFAAIMTEQGLHFKKEYYVPIFYNKTLLAKYFFDFYVENKIIIELKIRPRMGYIQVKQVLEYLKAANCKLGILIYFTKDGVKYRRIINPQS